MSNWSDVTGALKTALDAITGLGPIYLYEPNVTTESEFDSAFKEGTKINFCMLMRVGVTDDYAGTLQVFRKDSWELLFYYGYVSREATSSEQTFQEMVDSILEKLKVDPTLSALVDIRTAPQVEIRALAPRGSVICHAARFTFDTEHEVTY